MKTLGALTALMLLGGCATSDVVLLPAEPGSVVGSVVVLDQKTGTERGVLDASSTRTALGGAVRARPADAARYAALTDTLPPPAGHFMLYFVEGGTDLLPESEPVFEALMTEVGKRPGAEVQITGHTDTLGSSDENDTLSRSRAAEIRGALVARGLDPEVTRAVGRGERELLVPTEDGVREDRNRRVEVTVR